MYQEFILLFWVINVSVFLFQKWKTKYTIDLCWIVSVMTYYLNCWLQYYVLFFELFIIPTGFMLVQISIMSLIFIIVYLSVDPVSKRITFSNVRILFPFVYSPSLPFVPFLLLQNFIIHWYVNYASCFGLLLLFQYCLDWIK